MDNNANKFNVYNFQEPATPVAEGIIDLHNYIVFYLIIVLVFVVAILFDIVIQNFEVFKIKSFFPLPRISVYSCVINCYRLAKNFKTDLYTEDLALGLPRGSSATVLALGALLFGAIAYYFVPIVYHENDSTIPETLMDNVTPPYRVFVNNALVWVVDIAELDSNGVFRLIDDHIEKVSQSKLDAFIDWRYTSFPADTNKGTRALSTVERELISVRTFWNPASSCVEKFPDNPGLYYFPSRADRVKLLHFDAVIEKFLFAYRDFEFKAIANKPQPIVETLAESIAKPQPIVETLAESIAKPQSIKTGKQEIPVINIEQSYKYIEGDTAHPIVQGNYSKGANFNRLHCEFKNAYSNISNQSAQKIYNVIQKMVDEIPLPTPVMYDIDFTIAKDYRAVEREFYFFAQEVLNSARDSNNMNSKMFEVKLGDSVQTYFNARSRTVQMAVTKTSYGLEKCGIWTNAQFQEFDKPFTAAYDKHIDRYVRKYRDIQHVLVSAYKGTIDPQLSSDIYPIKDFHKPIRFEKSDFTGLGSAPYRSLYFGSHPGEYFSYYTDVCLTNQLNSSRLIKGENGVKGLDHMRKFLDKNLTDFAGNRNKLLRFKIDFIKRLMWEDAGPHANLELKLLGRLKNDFALSRAHTPAKFFVNKTVPNYDFAKLEKFQYFSRESTQFYDAALEFWERNFYQQADMDRLEKDFDNFIFDVTIFNVNCSDELSEFFSIQKDCEVALEKFGKPDSLDFLEYVPEETLEKIKAIRINNLASQRLISRKTVYLDFYLFPLLDKLSHTSVIEAVKLLSKPD